MNGNMIDYIAMGKRIWMRRNALNMNQRILAKRISVSTSFIGHLERGEKKPSVETIAKLSAALNTTTDYILFGRKILCDKSKCQLIEAMDELINGFRKE